MVKLELSPKQTPALTPQLVQAIEILQLNSQELLEYVSDMALENPVLELEDSPPREPVSVYGEFSQTCSSAGKSMEFDGEGDINRIPDRSAAHEDTLLECLSSQLESLGLEEGKRRSATVLAESLNENGWLDESLEEISAGCGFSVEMLESALEVLQSLEPAGIGARNLRECLLLQLERYYPDEQLAIEIVQNHLQAVSRLRYNAISERTGAGRQEVCQACALIRSLEPRPAREYAKGAEPEYIIPDVTVSRHGNRFEVRVNERFAPSLRVSSFYSELMKSCGDPGLKVYLTEKTKQAKWLVGAVERRHRTLCQCAASLVRYQESFFESSDGDIVPMSLSDIAVELDLHESTVSRALKGKYIQCSRGVFPMSRFFSRGFASADGIRSASPDGVKSALSELISKEDKTRPLSDRELCSVLSGMGCAVSRRTVAKYRDELGISNAAGRKIQNE